jgi:hypothetical protein
MKTKQKSGKVFMGAFVDPELKEKLKKISKAERRSLNAQVEFFLSLGVQHLKEQKQAA